MLGGTPVRSPLVDNTCLVEAGDDGGDDQCHHGDRQAEQGGDPGDVDVLTAVDVLREPAREEFQPVLPAVTVDVMTTPRRRNTPLRLPVTTPAYTATAR